ncbi:MAG: LPS export ABC transporter ATP-binding protein [Planctomycetaceae bacterium]|nr:LPS export ABC transporter ATP-binding protein [Planctomycetaceae bacterium]MCP4773188.1 LPS export ABC transporter ATP-binding protein [Planctomycetaceae bacterium]
MPILEAEGLVKIYGRRRVVDGVSLQVDPGEIVGLLGPNGAGKTTSFKMMCGLVRPDRGKVFLQDADVTQWPLHERSRSGGMGYLPQQASVFGKLSVEKNLKGVMQLLGFSRKQQKYRTEELLEQFKIGHIRKTRAGKLSGGERRRLEIARCLVSEPKIIMLDEPFAGIDPVTVQSIQIIIKSLATDGIAVLITDHAAREILQITDRTYVVSEGQVLCSGSQEEILSNPDVRNKYLGDIEIQGTQPAQIQTALPTTTQNTPTISGKKLEINPDSISSGMDTQASHPKAEPNSSPKFLQRQSEQRGLAPAEQEVVAALNAAGRDAPGDNERIPNRPKIVFADADQPEKKRKSFFKSNDLD